MPEIDPKIQRRLLEAVRQLAESADPEEAAAGLRDVYGEAVLADVDLPVRVRTR